MRKTQEARIWVERMLSGDWRVDDLSRLLRSLRQQTFGHTKVKDIADLTAHEDHRDQGVMVEAISDLYYATRLTLQLSRGAMRWDRLPQGTDRAINAAIHTLPDATLRRTTGLTKSSAQRLVRSALKKITVNSDGTIDARMCTSDELQVIGKLPGSFMVRPVYDDIAIFGDLQRVLVKNRLLEPREVSVFASTRDRMAVFILSLLHRLDVILPDGNTAELSLQMSAEQDGRVLEIGALWPAGVLDVRIGVVIFRTTLSGLQWCSEDLLKLASYSNGIAGNPATWTSPVDIVGGDWKLSPMA